MEWKNPKSHKFFAASWFPPYWTTVSALSPYPSSRPLWVCPVPYCSRVNCQNLYNKIPSSLIHLYLSLSSCTIPKTTSLLCWYSQIYRWLNSSDLFIRLACSWIPVNRTPIWLTSISPSPYVHTASSLSPVNCLPTLLSSLSTSRNECSRIVVHSACFMINCISRFFNWCCWRFSSCPWRITVFCRIHSRKRPLCSGGNCSKVNSVCVHPNLVLLIIYW